MAAYTTLGRRCLASLVLLTAVPVASQAPRPTVADGVYTAAQAERGELVVARHCVECHGGDLEGLEGPELAGSLFLRSWRARTLGDLFQKIVETMPKGAADSVTGADKLDALAYLLQANGFPEGRVELKPEAAVLASIAMGQSPDGQPVPGAIVKVTGCLKEAPNSQWLLTTGTTPLRLLNIFPRPTALAGHTVLVTGLFVRDPAGDAVNVISIESAVGVCAG